MAREERDVVIVGGGFAGVTAARDLQNRGLDCLLLEARDRLGGRTWTTEREGWKVELGGTWIHWTQPFVWSEAQRYGLAVEEVVGSVAERVILMVDGRTQEISEEQFGEFIDGFARFFEEVETVWQRPYDSLFRRNEIESRDAISVQERLDSLGLSALQSSAVGAFLETLTLSPLDEASYVEMMRVYALAGATYPLFSDSLSRYKFADGSRALIEAMLRDGAFEVRVDTPVAKIRHQSSGVEVETRQGDLVAARAVVVTVPMNVLHTLEFEPGISQRKIEASHEKHAGKGFKIFLEVEGDPGSVMMLSRVSDNPLGGCFTFQQGSERSLFVGFGNDASCLNEMSTQDWQAALERFLPGIRVTKAFGHAWTVDPWSEGTWCSYKAGQFTRFADDLARHEGRVFFASGDHGEGWRGFIDGAIGSASRTATSVADALS